MQFRIIPALIVFVASYLPLSLILLAQDFQYEHLFSGLCVPGDNTTAECEIPFRNAQFSISIFVVCLGAFFVALIGLSSVRPNVAIDIEDVKYVPAELMSYTLPYVVSFMSIEYQETGKFVGLLIFLGWMFVITYRSGQLVLNPILIVFGWRLYEVKYRFPKTSDSLNGRVISKEKLRAQTRCLKSTVQDILVVGPAKEHEKE